MPYIEQDKRTSLRNRAPATPGELNYEISRMCDNFIMFNRGGVSYEGLNEVIGVLACVSQELYRRVVAPYEDQKMIAHGDVFNAVDEVEAMEKLIEPPKETVNHNYSLSSAECPACQQEKEKEHGQTKPRRSY